MIQETPPTSTASSSSSTSSSASGSGGDSGHEMSREDEVLAAAATYIRSLALGSTSQTTSPLLSRSSSGSGQILDFNVPKLPGPRNPSKDAFEIELAALARRTQYLELKADNVNQALPDTPNEGPVATSPFEKTSTEINSSSGPVSRHASRGLHSRSGSLTTRSVRVSNLLAAREAQNGEQDFASRTVSEDDIGILREHVQKQAEEIKMQRELLTNISADIHKSEARARKTLMKVENEDVGMLERELHKHQQANEAFQKALREIGGIITQVANGDLSMRVQIQASEMDAEIAAFKRTINTMMDQLEVFGSEVSRVAREVGTEGILGGQAQISGVHGIWKELTENGKLLRQL